MTAPYSKTSPGVRPCRGTRSVAPGRSWPSPRGSGPRPSPPTWSATSARCAAPANATATAGWRASWRSPSDRAARPGFPPLQRAQIVELACLEPVAKGLHITHWSSEDLARQAVADGIVEAISPRTVRRILDRVDLQPHRTRYWRTTRLDPLFKARAEKVLWCYANAERLARQGYWVVCADEMPNFQVLERHPIRRAIPGSIEQREFDYTRHGTVNILAFLVVHTGRMRAVVLEQNDAAHYIPALEEFRRRHRLPAGRLPDPRRRPEPHRRGDGGLLRRLPRLVAAPADAGAGLVAGPGGVADPRLRRPLPEAKLVARPGGVHPACRRTPGRSTTSCTPTRSSGRGPTRRCAAGSRDIGG